METTGMSSYKTYILLKSFLLSRYNVHKLFYQMVNFYIKNINLLTCDKPQMI